MSNKPKKQPEKEGDTLEKAQPFGREFLKDTFTGFTYECDPDRIFSKVAKEIDKLPEKDRIPDKINKVILKSADELVMAKGIGTLLGITETVGERYRPLVISVARQLTEEYKCETPSEKALVEVAAGAYVRIIEYSRRLHNSIGTEYLSSEKNGYYSLMSKEVDRATRHFQSALTTLKHMKTPPMSVKVTTQTAFLAQNQQINAATQENPTNSTRIENNEPE